MVEVTELPPSIQNQRQWTRQGPIQAHIHSERSVVLPVAFLDISLAHGIAEKIAKNKNVGALEMHKSFETDPRNSPVW